MRCSLGIFLNFIAIERNFSLLWKVLEKYSYRKKTILFCTVIFHHLDLIHAYGIDANGIRFDIVNAIHSCWRVGLRCAL